MRRLNVPRHIEGKPALEQIKVLQRMTKATAEYFDEFAKVTANPKCDKHAAGFALDDRFRVCGWDRLSFDAWTGYYGNSGCTQFGVPDGEVLRHYLVRAMNVHRKNLFAIAAQLMSEDAASLLADARDELNAAQAMLDKLSAPQEATE